MKMLFFNSSTNNVKRDSIQIFIKITTVLITKMLIKLIMEKDILYYRGIFHFLIIWSHLIIIVIAVIIVRIVMAAKIIIVTIIITD